MHLDPDTQRRAHAEIVGAALPARWRDVAVLSHAAPRPLGYRGRARLHVRAGRGRASVGMFEVETRDPVEVDACVALVPELDRARARLGPLLEGCRGRGEAQIALGPFDDDPRRPVLELRWDGELAPAVFARLEEGVLRGQWKGARVWSGEVRVPAVVGSPAPWILGGDGEPLALAPGGFAQASDEGNALLAGRVAALAEVGRGGRALELHAGSGNLTVVLARVAPGMTAVESSPDACAAARANLGRRGLDARVVEADAAEHLRARAAGPRLDLVVLDPPRTGARAVAEALAKTPARHVLYVSCDPQTLGRDLAILGERYTPRAVESVEMFPQTSHVESIVLLEKKRP
jgi:23S rRNA (uracil1939-C5)-methyltransferase